ncbi:MAG: bifunctional precorrin-2 dehydrogenase/sirohydrochlorin ferrochelatase [Methanophagales archaeon]|nr:bifunctional precorrin-2 dehydrogenase/sirohydrochlorin ferrochelatase [Methanophagales archaeon]
MLPLYVDLSGKRIVVFGGGTIAERKIHQILDTNREGALRLNVEVYSLDFTPRIEEMNEEGEIQCFQCDLWDQNLGEIIKGAFLVLVCTDDETLNGRILKETTKFDALVNYRHVGDVFLSSVVNKGGFLISVSTSGKGPAMARYMKTKISSLIGDKEEKMLLIQSNLREYLKGKIKEEVRRREILNRVLDDPECWAALDAPVKVAEKLIFKIVGDKYNDA